MPIFHFTSLSAISTRGYSKVETKFDVASTISLWLHCRSFRGLISFVERTHCYIAPCCHPEKVEINGEKVPA